MKKQNRSFDLRSFIVGKLRAAFKKAPIFSAARNKAKEEYFIPSKTGRPMRRVRFKCAKCGKFFSGSGGEIAVDHIRPVVDLKEGWKDYNTFIERLFCDLDNLQVLCNYKGLRDGVRSCHSQKTAEERKLSAKNKRENKEKK